MMAIRTTIATIGTKPRSRARLLPDEFLMDLRSGLGAAAGGKLVEGVLEPVAKQVAAYVGTTRLSKGFAGKVMPQLGKAGMWEAENLITTATGNVATNQDIASGMGLEAQAGSLIQEGVTAGIRGARGGPTKGGGGTEERLPGTGRDRPGPRPRMPARCARWMRAPEARSAPRSWVGSPAVVRRPRPARRPVMWPPPAAPRLDAAARVDVDPVRARRAYGPCHGARLPAPFQRMPQDLTPFPTKPTTPSWSPCRSSQSGVERLARTRRVAPSGFVVTRRRSDRPLLPMLGVRHWRTTSQTCCPTGPSSRIPERLERLEKVVNARLEQAGLPRVYVELGTMPEGHAAFSMKDWKICVSTDSLRTQYPSLETFAGLADATAHEARHALHMFRGYRAALMEGTFRPGEGISPLAQVAAAEANAGTMAAEELVKGTPKYDEALAIHQEFYQSRAATRRRHQNDRALAKAQYRVRQLRAELDQVPPGSAQRATLLEQLRLAVRRLDRVHNTYISRSHEVDAWRMGSSTRAAVIDEVTRRRITTLEEDLSAAQAEGARHVANQQERRSYEADTSRVDALVKASMRREREIEQEIDMLRRQLEAAEAIRTGEEAPATEVWPPHEDFDATEP